MASLTRRFRSQLVETEPRPSPLDAGSLVSGGGGQPLRVVAQAGPLSGCFRKQRCLAVEMATFQRGTGVLLGVQAGQQLGELGSPTSPGCGFATSA